MWKNVRHMRPRKKQSEIMDWIERSNSEVCVVSGIGLTGEEYMELSDGLLQIESERKEALVVHTSLFTKKIDVRK